MTEDKKIFIEEYWLNKLSGDLSPVTLPQLPQYGHRNTDNDESPRVLSLPVPPAAADALTKISKGNDKALFVLALAALELVIHKYTGISDLVMGSLSAKQDSASQQPLFFRNNISGDMTFKEFIGIVKKDVLESFKHSEPGGYIFNDVYTKLLNKNRVEQMPLFNVAFTYDRIHGKPDEADDSDPLKTFPLVFTLSTSSSGNGAMSIDIRTGDGTYVSGNGNNILHRFCQSVILLWSQMPGNLDTPVAQIDILSPTERQQILNGFNETTVDYPSDTVIHRLFEAQVERTPENIAIVGADGTTFTYRQLNQKADSASRLLRKQGIGPGTIAAILTAQTPEMVVGIMAVLKAGGAYLPIDPMYPAERITFMLKDSAARVLLTQRQLIETGGETLQNETTVFLEDLMALAPLSSEIASTDEIHHPRDAAYVIYTSGTTGQPKGTMIAHHSLNNLCHWHNRHYEVTAADRATKYAGIGFDASVWELFPYLVAGASVYIVPDEIKTDISRLSRFLCQSGITVAFFPPQVCEQLMANLGGLGGDCPLRLMLSGGDRLRRFRKTSYLLANNYGPTENTVVSTCFTVDTSQEYSEIPIGKPIDNTKLYVLNPYQQVQPVGVAGELCIGGVGLAIGYLNRPELTAQRFFSHRQTQIDADTNDLLSSSDTVDSQSHPSHLSHTSYYQTGDLARWLPDGNIEFLGRIDHQVKIRGFRIELGEIENRLMEHPAVKQAVVVSRDGGEPGGKYLCAYIVTGDPELSPNNLKTFAATKLPDYMIPAFIIPMETIPLTANGKVDTRALPLPDAGRSRVGVEYEPPGTEMEKKIVSAWQEVLNLENIGINDRFFDLGGDSLNIIQLNNRINEMMGMEIPQVVFFEYPTVKSVAAYLDKERSGEGVGESTTAVDTTRSKDVQKGKDRRKQRIQKRKSKEF